MLNTVSTVCTTDQQANCYQLQELLQKAQERVEYFFDINLDVISEWVNQYKECLNQINQQNQMNQDTQKIQNISSTLQNLISNIEIIKTEGMLLVGNFKPWMSGVGMINFPFGYTIYGKITFGILNGNGVIKKNKNNTKIIGNFNQNKLQGEGTIIINNEYQINGLFDKGKIISGPIKIKILNGQEIEIQAQLNIDADQIELSNKQQFREKVYLSSFEYIRPDNIIYKAPQFILGLSKQNSYTLYQNKELMQEYRNGILQNGVGQVLTSSNIQLNGNFIDGALNGFGQLIDKNKNLLLEGEFLNNKMSQGKKFYLESMILHEEGQFNEQTQLSGNGKRYFNTAGLIQEEGRFENGQLHGEGIRYFQIDEQQNKIMEKGDFENGILILGTKFYQNGLIKEKGEFNNNQLQGEGERRHQNGYIQEYGIFQDGQLHSQNEKSGRANVNGVIIEIGYFLNGTLEGEGQRFYPNGKTKEIGMFSQGLLNGNGKKYYDNEENSLEEEGLFQGGKLDSRIANISKQYYQDGSIKCYGMFQNGLLTTIDGALYFNQYEMKGVFQNGQVNGTMRIFNSITQKEFKEDHLQSNETFLRAANKAGVYLGSQFNTNAQQSYKRI